MGGKELMKIIFEMLAEIIVISGNKEIDSVLLGIISLISFSFSFNLIGFIFGLFGFYDSNFMSDLHWFFKIIIFIILSWILILVFRFFNWILNLEWWGYVILVISILLIAIFCYYFTHKNKKIKNTCNENKNDIAKAEKTEICPKCGGKLLVKKGRYGKFYGCENYLRTNCRYTRRIN